MCEIKTFTAKCKELERIVLRIQIKITLRRNATTYQGCSAVLRRDEDSGFGHAAVGGHRNEPGTVCRN